MKIECDQHIQQAEKYQEWQATPEAKIMNRSYYQVNVMPFPKNTTQFIIEYRNRDGAFVKLFEYEIDPTNYFIQEETVMKVKHSKMMGTGDASKSIDVAFVAEGYTQEEMGKFRADVERIAGYVLNVEPFKAYADRFNIYALESVSEESGPDIPGKHIYKNTVLNSNFYTFDSERYLTTSDLKSMHDIAANVPYDHIFVLIKLAIHHVEKIQMKGHKHLTAFEPYPIQFQVRKASSKSKDVFLGFGDR